MRSNATQLLAPFSTYLCFGTDSHTPPDAGRSALKVQLQVPRA